MQAALRSAQDLQASIVGWKPHMPDRASDANQYRPRLFTPSGLTRGQVPEVRITFRLQQQAKLMQ